jgi:hypothetical protein
MMNLSLFCFSLIMFLGVCGMLGYVLSAYQRLLADNERLKSEQGKINSTSVQIANLNGDQHEISEMA